MPDLIFQSLKIIEGLYDKRKENIIAFSGGKDSIVLYHLAMLTKLPFTYIYTNTTIDPPGHISFIRENYPNVQIIQPRYSFYEIVAKYGLPTRHRRFCCIYLKEYIGKGAKVFEGLRIDEGIKRGKRLSALHEPEMCDTRVKGKIHAYPIMHWTEKDIWDFIKKRNLPYPKFYDMGFKRLGCIGCPLANHRQRIIEYTMFPKYALAVIKAIDKNISSGKSISKFFDDPWEAFYWWIMETSIKIHKENNMFTFDFERRVKELLSIF